ncbi:hypothetical protein Q4577_20695 [Marinovum sp. 2_MG-2023]|uniref:hypothetical protein n=1 Tax=unclassified Marinovum TaxID=2647166 RepID=UPI0026E19B94|nr:MULTISPECIES: hypothetical protein [unclassified Marinovum]MDO6732453.1 hypothetical protein [Marinovum sp. 2_MG-2023]MDO6781770.1 hypothetical protein [Marinovum sp. 1_MG-2023]
MTLQEEVAKLVLVIENEQPVPALALSELLASLARDYRKQNRARTLVVARVEDGSILITLLDMAQAALPYTKSAVEVAKGAKALIEFGKTLTGLLKAKKNDQAAVEQPQAKSPTRSIEKILKLAVDANCSVRLRQVEADGSCLEVEVTPSEAVAIRKSEQDAKEASALDGSPIFQERVPEVKRAVEIADELERLQISDELSASGALQIILGIIKRSGDAELLMSVAMELEGRGYKDLAATIRNA